MGQSLLGAEFVGGEFVWGRVCQGPSLLGAEMSRNRSLYVGCGTRPQLFFTIQFNHSLQHLSFFLSLIIPYNTFLSFYHTGFAQT